MIITLLVDRISERVVSEATLLYILSFINQIK